MAEYRKWTVWITWSRQQVGPYSNHVFVAVVPLLGLYPLFGIFTVAITWMTWAYFGALILVLGANLMAKQVLTKQIEKMKEALWSFKIESPS